MTAMRNFEAEAAAAVRTARNDLGRIFGHREDPRTQVQGTNPGAGIPAAQPVNLAPAGAATKEDSMSVITDLEDGYAAVKTELAKFEQALPGALAKAKAFEASPFAQLAEKTAASVLPPEAVTIAVNAADKVIDDLIGLYTPAQAQQAAPAQ